MAEGTNTRFVPTSSSDGPEEPYERYVGRGGVAKTRSKISRRTSRPIGSVATASLLANRFRLPWQAAAYGPKDTSRRKLVEAGVRRVQLDAVRLKPIEIGGRVRRLLTRRCVWTWGMRSPRSTPVARSLAGHRMLSCIIRAKSSRSLRGFTSARSTMGSVTSMRPSEPEAPSTSQAGRSRTRPRRRDERPQARDR
jgi:hypothetical protein